MIKHIVMWKLNNDNDKETALAEARQKLLSLRNSLPAELLSSIEVGINSDKGTGSHDIVLITEHNNWEALQGYQNHPEHLKIAAYVKENLSQRSCVDFEY
ncbi:Dabb family protein [Spirochaetia bacterium 38H-sp]|uniref:Dabb family protein n=1 Tax=Rarispira pelagica TaxID=3141764 RepID=A0ABU9UAI8_9SPIR